MDTMREFGSVWKKFMVLCRAKLMEKSKQCSLSAPAAEMAIQDAVSIWFDPYEVCGQWLRSFEKEEPQAAEKVKNVLHGIKLENIPRKNNLPDLGVLGVTIGGAAAGAGFGACLFHLGTLGTVFSAVVPAIVLYPALKGYQKTEKEKAEKEEITKYMEQISLVREEIEGILNSIM